MKCLALVAIKLTGKTLRMNGKLSFYGRAQYLVQSFLEYTFIFFLPWILLELDA